MKREDQKGAVPLRSVPHGRDQREAVGGVCWLPKCLLVICEVLGGGEEMRTTTPQGSTLLTEEIPSSASSVASFFSL